MKLRNKLGTIYTGGKRIVVYDNGDVEEEILGEEPAEPLIKDEKIRKAVRAWASENIIKQAEFEYIAGTGSIFKDGVGGVEIGFYDDLRLTNREIYTIAELCGEEEK